LLREQRFLAVVGALGSGKSSGADEMNGDSMLELGV